MSKFQLILLIVFGAFILVAVLVFSLSRGSSNAAIPITIWGDISTNDFNIWANDSGINTNKSLNITYIEKNPETFDSQFTEALAEGKGPDLVVIHLNNLWKNKNKILPISNQTLNEADYKNTFIEEGESFLSTDGTYALPLVVDPMVLYWNRDLFTSASFSKPPQYWDEIYDYASKLSIKDAAGNLSKSAITLGESKNIPHAKDILSLLMLQAGTPITDYVNGTLHSEIGSSFDLPVAPAEAALDFYTQFANPAKPFYSWNRSLRTAPTAFVAGDVAMYIGYASELKSLQAKNPNLNIGIAPIPQSRVSGKSITFADLRGIAIVKSSSNPAAALSAALTLISKDVAAHLSKILNLPPARRDLLQTRPTDANLSVFYSSAIQAKGFIDPNNTSTANIFTDMIDSVTSGQARVQEAVSNGSREVDDLIK